MTRGTMKWGWLLAVLTAGLVLPCTADETVPPAQPAAGLTLRFHGKLPPHVKLSRIEGLIGSFLNGEEQERKVAEDEMIKTGPLPAFVVRERLVSEADAAVRERLEGLARRLEADTSTNAKVIFHFAQALATVDKGSGPLDWEDPGLERWRAMAKVFHLCYLDPEHYGEKIDQSLTTFEPVKDLPAAAAEYKEAGAMWDRLAAAAKDAPEAAQDRAEAAKCREGAAKAEKDASGVK